LSHGFFQIDAPLSTVFFSRKIPTFSLRNTVLTPFTSGYIHLYTAQHEPRSKGEIADQELNSQETIEDLEAKIKDAKAHLSEITDAAGDAWENIKEI
jgi:hypothetical protein